MKKLFLTAAACAALAACGSNEEPAPAPVDTSVPEVGTTATGDMTGTYEIQMADGTYVDSTVDGTETERGTWRQEGAQMCFDPAGDEAEACYAGGAPGEDGSFEMRDASGSVVSTVRKVEG